MADSTMNSIQDTLRKTMDKLSMDDFKALKFHLKDMDKIPWLKLEKADRVATIELIVETFTKECSGDTVLKILRKMNLNQTAKDLEKDLTGENTGRESFRTGWNQWFIVDFEEMH